MVLVRSRHSPRGERMGGCGEANNGSETSGDWAVAVNGKAKVRPHEKTIVASVKQFLMPMGTTFRAGATQRPRLVGRDLFSYPNHTKEKRGKGVQQIAYDARQPRLLQPSAIDGGSRRRSKII